MALITCPECGKQISESAGNCPNCGYQLTAEVVAATKEKAQQEQKTSWIGCLSILAVFVVSFALVSNCSDSSKPAAPREVVENSAWDGSVAQVETWLRQNLKDPDSLEFIEWSRVVKGKGGFMVRVKYRAKNSFGGYVVEQKLFTLDTTGAVTGSLDY
ncbi:MAG: zinc ribbon domain-containing protein [Thermodesulfobacteriota bacterium]